MDAGGLREIDCNKDVEQPKAKFEKVFKNLAEPLESKRLSQRCLAT